MKNVNGSMVPQFARSEEEIWPGYRHWLDLVIYTANRPYFQDQTPYSLDALERFVHATSPTVIVELGTANGMSCRAWLRAAPTARMVCVDLSFKALRASTNILPLDMSRLTLVEADILKVDLSRYWGPDDKVLLFVDAHDLPNVPIMRHVLDTAVPHLPPGSMVVVDDLWYSPQTLTHENAPAFLQEAIVPRIDSLGCLEAHYAPYHAGGSFVGFAEVVPLLEFVNRHKLTLHFSPLSKNVGFAVPVPVPAADFAADAFAAACGVVWHNPLMLPDVPAAHAAEMRRFASLYAKAGPARTEQALMELVEHQRAFPGVAYALAVCRAYQRDLPSALRFLETNGADALPQAATLRADVERFLHPLRDTGTQRRKGVTLFTIPMAFAGHRGRIQRNALESWARLSPRPDVMLFGDAPGVAEAAARLGMRHVPHIACNEYGTPLLDDVFRQAQEAAETDLVAYVNADIILFDDFMRACGAAREALPQFLMVGHRQDYTLLEDIDFDQPDWAARLRADAVEKGMRHAETGIDYFVYVPGLWPKIPPFAIGRTSFDNWLLGAAHALGKPVVDATGAVFCIHQQHGYGHARGGLAGIGSGAEARRNRALAGPLGDKCFICGATYAVNADGSVTPREPTASTFTSWEEITKRMRWLLQQAGFILPTSPEDVPDILEAISREFSTLCKKWNPAVAGAREAQPHTAELLAGHTVRLAAECTGQIGVNVWAEQGGKLVGSLGGDERCIVALVHERVRGLKDPIVFDIGANTGLVAFLPVVKEDLTVFAFEPNPDVVRVLQKNLELNKLSEKVVVFPQALADHDGVETLKIPTGHTGLSCLGKPRRFSQWREVIVPVNRLDTVVEALNPPRLDCIKIDTEGCELFVLRGARRTIERYKPDLLVECWEENMRQFDYSMAELRSHLEGLGYNFTMVTQEDALCVHRSKA